GHRHRDLRASVPDPSRDDDRAAHPERGGADGLAALRQDLPLRDRATAALSDRRDARAPRSQGMNTTVAPTEELAAFHTLAQSIARLGSAAPPVDLPESERVARAKRVFIQKTDA